MDWIGHGGSDGLHAYVHSLDDAVTDMKMFLGRVLAENSKLPCFCFGHSTGGAIILKAVLDPKVSECLSGIILTSPAVGVQPSRPIFSVLAPVFSFLLPRFQFSAADKQGIAVSRDPEALVAKYSDPLVFTGSIRIRTGYEILRITSYLQKNLSWLTAPFFVLHGTADSVTDPKASEKLYDEASSSDKTIQLYEGYDIFFKAASAELNADSHSVIMVLHWAVAFEAAISKYGGASAGYRTLLDALFPASLVLKEKLTAGDYHIGAFVLSAEAAVSGAESTKDKLGQLKSKLLLLKLKLAVLHVSTDILAPVPDPGAMAAASWYKAAALAVKDKYRAS
ncbi:unnamed protein product [Fraxinus pennsylvanica]|uniref:DhaL domain-containing protein n=1 Tax=Fraxinus pennsylvanica TaxID=56036 RepID=A0AAD1ZI07_9LAMI|nr:unnamed protein product [Fraxinus pennsylvanica]